MHCDRAVRLRITHRSSRWLYCRMTAVPAHPEGTPHLPVVGSYGGARRPAEPQIPFSRVARRPRFVREWMCDDSPRRAETLKLSNSQTFKLSNFQTFKLSNLQTLALSPCLGRVEMLKFSLLRKLTENGLRCNFHKWLIWRVKSRLEKFLHFFKIHLEFSAPIWLYSG